MLENIDSICEILRKFKLFNFLLLVHNRLIFRASSSDFATFTQVTTMMIGFCYFFNQIIEIEAFKYLIKLEKQLYNVIKDLEGAASSSTF